MSRLLCALLLLACACADEVIAPGPKLDASSNGSDASVDDAAADEAAAPDAMQDAANSNDDAAVANVSDAGPCYSPKQNLDVAYQDGAQGCPCTPDDEDICTKGVALICSEGRWQAVNDGPCLVYTRLYTPDACAEAGGVSLSDPGDGSLLRDGCPAGMQRLGNVTGYIEGGLCCRKLAASSCAPQDARMVGGCEPAPRYFWTGNGCHGASGCSCAGSDCDEGFDSLEACQAAFASCEGKVKLCGGWLGNTCAANEYCAYRGVGLCGAADASATCQPRPRACDSNDDPVCGCDGRTYGNECEAAMKGTGVAQFYACRSLP